MPRPKEPFELTLGRGIALLDKGEILDPLPLKSRGSKGENTLARVYVVRAEGPFSVSLQGEGSKVALIAIERHGEDRRHAILAGKFLVVADNEELAAGRAEEI